MSTPQEQNTPHQKSNIAEMTVGRSTSVTQLSLAIVKTLEEGKVVRLISIGANAVNQATKAAGKARGMLAQQGVDIAWSIYFTDRQMGPRVAVEDLPPEAVSNRAGQQSGMLSAMVHQTVILSQ